jgi:putative oxidoreductase
MLDRFFATRNELAPLLLRLTLGLVMLPHGLQKTLGMFGGYGFSGTMNFFTQMGIPTGVALLVILAESFGAVGLLAGFATRLGALGIGLTMLGAILLVHWPNGFFMNWGGNQTGEGFEFHLLALGIALALLIKGGGALSIDRLIARRD